MVITKKILQELSDKYQLDFDKFKFVDKTNFFKKIYFIFYSREEYFFQINKNNEDLKNFFPYFAQSNEITNIEALRNLEIQLKGIKEQIDINREENTKELAKEIQVLAKTVSLIKK